MLLSAGPTMATINHGCWCHGGESIKTHRSHISAMPRHARRSSPQDSPHIWSHRQVSCHANQTQSAVDLTLSQPASRASDKKIDQQQQQQHNQISRRSLGALTASAAAAALLSAPSPAHADVPFVTSPSGLRTQDISEQQYSLDRIKDVQPDACREGRGTKPRTGDLCSIHWSGYTSGYQGKRIDNTSTRDEPYEFILGAGQAIPAFEEAVAGMAVGGLRRIEVLGEHPELSYARDRSERFANELFGEGTKYRYRKGPQPKDYDGERALDFVLDNDTLQDFNRTLLFDIKLLTVRKGS